MYEYIIGNLVDKGKDYIVLENNKIGYKIYISQKCMSTLNIDNNVKIYTYLKVKEDDICLYGFCSYEELEMFKLLLLVSKVGPKIALGMLSILSPNEIKLGIVSNDYKILSKAPGIGKKTANRIILELKDRIDNNIIIDNNIKIEEDNSIEEAIGGLLSLGYTRREIDKALTKIDLNGLKTEEIIKISLKKLSKN